MDERLEKAYNFSNYRLTLESKIKTLKLKLKEQLLYSINGGVFEINLELINYLNLLEQQQNVILLDQKENPILFKEIEEFRQTVQQKYHAALNEYYTGMTELRKLRSVQAVVNGPSE